MTASAPSSSWRSRPGGMTASASTSSRCAPTTSSSRAPSRCSSSIITRPGSSTTTVAAAVVASIAEGCRQAGCALIGGETAEMPGMYAGGRLRPRRLLRRRGRARQGADRREHRARRRHPRPRQLGRPQQRLLAGPPDHRAATAGTSTSPSRRPAAGRSARSLLEPTRIYVRALLPLVQQGQIKGLAHITGGGLLENIPRVLPDSCHAIVDADRWQLPPLFALLQAGRRDRRRRKWRGPSTAASAWP